MKKSILVVDDEELERELLRQIFEADFNIITASNGKEALIQLSKHFDEIVIILLDLAMPVLNGYQLLQVLHASETYRATPVAMITATDSHELEIACYTMGAVSVINKPFSVPVVRNQVHNIIEMYQSTINVKETLTAQLKKTNAFYGNLIDSVCSMAEFRLYDSGVHVKRIKGFTRIMCDEYIKLYPDDGLTHDIADVIVEASAVHDIGKLAIPDNILLKAGPLTQEETQVIMSHTTKGCEIISMFPDYDEERYKITYDICRYHHERYDGKGYPEGLSGDDIPLSAQLVSIVHAYESLIGKRVYKKPCDKETAFKKIMNGEKGVFNPKILSCFSHAKNQLEAFANNTR